ncbi:MAG: hypothetical protein ACRC1K_05095 [Planctomycetia bacterium]
MGDAATTGSAIAAHAAAGDLLRGRLAAWIGNEVVVDCVSPFVAVGRLARAGDDYLELVDADLHDLRDASTTRELYVVKTVRHGVAVNRKRLLFRMTEVVGVARLSDVVGG